MAAKNEIKITHVFAAPVKTVWEAWIDPKQTAQWWGPRGFTLTTHSKDFKVGGHWAYTMHGPDGTDYPNKTIYHEIEQYKKLVYDHGGNDDRPPLFRVTVQFTDVKGRTLMDMTMTLPTPEAAEQTRKFIKEAGGDGTWDRLAEYLEKEITGKENFVINRSFNAPLELMFDLWTDPAHMTQWTPPKGFTMEFIRCDIRTGGGGFYVMSSSSGNQKMYGLTQYIEIRRPDRIVYTQQFCDENGTISRHPMAPTWPETMLTTITLAAESPTRTRVTVTWEPYGNVSAAELETFIQARAGMTGGWTGSFDKLETYLEGGGAQAAKAKTAR